MYRFSKIAKSAKSLHPTAGQPETMENTTVTHWLSPEAGVLNKKIHKNNGGRHEQIWVDPNRWFWDLWL